MRSNLFSEGSPLAYFELSEIIISALDDVMCEDFFHFAQTPTNEEEITNVDGCEITAFFLPNLPVSPFSDLELFCEEVGLKDIILDEIEILEKDISVEFVENMLDFVLSDTADQIRDCKILQHFYSSYTLLLDELDELIRAHYTMFDHVDGICEESLEYIAEKNGDLDSLTDLMLNRISDMVKNSTIEYVTAQNRLFQDLSLN